MARGALLLLLFPALAAAQGARPTARATARPAETASRFTSAELAALRPLVVADLNRWSRRYGDGPLSEQGLRLEFQQCSFAPLNLGKLGWAMIVQSNIGSGGQNGGWMGIYLPDHDSWKRIDEAAGYGPTVRPRPNGIPDLVFTFAGGACHAIIWRDRWQGSQYKEDACDQEVGGKTDICGVAPCDRPNKLPTFPDPWQ